MARTDRLPPEVAAAIAHLEASGVVAEALAAFRVDHVYAVEMAEAHAQMRRASERQRLGWATRSARAA